MKTSVLIGALSLGLILILLIAATIHRRIIQHRRRRRAALEEGEQIQARLELLAETPTGERPTGTVLRSRH
ncbi:MAG TPA: hypothetical protein VEU11_01170 [Terriglobales bacterium]|nr:hypothetical protein [Terriglobales bacterium]